MIRVIFLAGLSAAPGLHLVDDLSRSTLTIGERAGEKTTCCLELHPLNGIQKLLGCSNFSGHEGPCKGGLQVTLDGKGAGCGAPSLFRAAWKFAKAPGLPGMFGEIDEKEQWKAAESELRMPEKVAQEFEKDAKKKVEEAEGLEAKADEMEKTYNEEKKKGKEVHKKDREEIKTMREKAEAARLVASALRHKSKHYDETAMSVMKKRSEAAQEFRKDAKKKVEEAEGLEAKADKMEETYNEKKKKGKEVKKEIKTMREKADAARLVAWALRHNIDESKHYDETASEAAQESEKDAKKKVEEAEGLEAKADKMEKTYNEEKKEGEEVDKKEEIKTMREKADAARLVASALRHHIDESKRYDETAKSVMKKRSEAIQRRWKGHLVSLLAKVGTEKRDAMQLDMKDLGRILTADLEYEVQREFEAQQREFQAQQLDNLFGNIIIATLKPSKSV